jgi:hypothetical protein
VEVIFTRFDAWWEMTGAKNAEGQDIPLRKGLLNFVMTKDGDRWFIAVCTIWTCPPHHSAVECKLAFVVENRN